MNVSTLETWSPRSLAALRIITGLLFLEHGLMKLIGFPAPQPGVPHPLPLILQVAAWMEAVGGPLIVLGLFTRPVAFLLSGEMAIGYFLFHAPQGFYPALNMGEPAILYTFIFFYLVFAGAGAFSLDGLLNEVWGSRGAPARSTR